MESILRDIVAYIAFLLIFLEFFSYFFRKKNALKKLGEKKESLHAKSSVSFIILFILSSMLIGLIYIKKMEFFLSLAMYAIAIRALEMAVRDFTTNKLQGIYEHGLVINKKIILYDDIIDFYPFAPKDEDDKEIPDDEQYIRTSRLDIVTKSKSLIYVNFSSIEEKEMFLNFYKSRFSPSSDRR